MLLSSVNSLDYALDVVTNNKQNEIDIDKNTYKNLNQDDNIEEVINSTALTFNNQEESNNKDNTSENINNPLRKKKSKIFDFNNIFDFTTNLLKFLSPLFVITVLTFLIYTYLSILKNIFPYWYKNFMSYENHKIFYTIFKYLIFFLLNIINHIPLIIRKILK